LDKLCEWYGQAFNEKIHQSILVETLVPSTNASLSGVLCPLKEPIKAKYLGLPLFMSRSKKASFDDTTAKV
jgi:hypothetical protein